LTGTIDGQPSPWLVLLRAPNLLTVPGDIVAGACLAASDAGVALDLRLPVLIAASLCLYSAGMVLNDWFDRERDRAGRPERPLPAGKVSARAALACGVTLNLAGIGLAATAGPYSLATAAAIVVTALFYNAGAKRIPIVGAVVMGSCRGLNLLLGASIAFPRLSQVVITAAIAVGIYIAAVTAMAARETEGAPRPAHRALVPIMLLCGIALVTRETKTGIAELAVWAIPVAAVYWALMRRREERETPETIGSLLRALIPLQAAFVVASAGHPLSAAGVYALWPLSALAGRRIRGS
jgi:4-hydroxybenzoate polyprenyltransferase